MTVEKSSKIQFKKSTKLYYYVVNYLQAKKPFFMNGEKRIKIRDEYITLGQFLKFARIIDQGGEAKYYLATRKVLVNGEEENRRGRKLREGDKIVLDEGTFVIER